MCACPEKKPTLFLCLPPLGIGILSQQPDPKWQTLSLGLSAFPHTVHLTTGKVVNSTFKIYLTVPISYPFHV